MNGLSKLFLIIFIWEVLWFSIYKVFIRFVSAQDKQEEKWKEEQKQGIIRTHYVIRKKKRLIILFIIETTFFISCTFLCWLILSGNIGVINENSREEGMWCVYFFAVLSFMSLAGALNMLFWKLEVKGEGIVWRSGFGIVRRFCFNDITEYERTKYFSYIYVNNKKMIQINGNVDSEEFMEDMKRHGIQETDAFIKKMERKKKKH